MYLLLALAAAAAYGAADFLGGMASRLSPIVTVIVVSQSVGLVVGLVAAPLAATAAAPEALVWGGAGGLAYGAGTLLLYRGLAIGRMSAVAPITAVCAVAVPLVLGLWFGERLGSLALAGVAAAAIAIALVSRGSPAGPGGAPAAAAAGGTEPAVMATAICSGVAFGLFFVCFARTGADAGLWPVVAARAVSLAGFAVAALLTGCSFQLPRAALLAAIAAGALEISANTLYMLAASAGTMSLAATLTSLYPASTVILARLVLRERIGRLQAAGLAFALLAAVLMTAT